MAQLRRTADPAGNAPFPLLRTALLVPLRGGGRRNERHRTLCRRSAHPHLGHHVLLRGLLRRSSVGLGLRGLFGLSLEVRHLHAASFRDRERGSARGG